MDRQEGETYEAHAVDLWVSSNVLRYISLIRPFGNHRKLEQLWSCNTHHIQNIFVLYPLRDDNFFAILLERRSG